MKLLAFGIVKDIFNSPEINLPVWEKTSVDTVKEWLESKYPALKELGSYLVAVNNEYAEGDMLLQLSDEIAIIPPVSGG